MLANTNSVRVLDLFMYGDTIDKHPNVELIKGDLRDLSLVKKCIKDVDAIIHLACISNDPSFDLNLNLENQ